MIRIYLVKFDPILLNMIRMNQILYLKPQTFVGNCEEPISFLGLVCPSRLLTAKVGHTRHCSGCCALPSTKKDPKMDITVYMDVAGAELEASDTGLGGRRGQKQKVCFLVKRTILLSD